MVPAAGLLWGDSMASAAMMVEMSASDSVLPLFSVGGPASLTACAANAAPVRKPLIGPQIG